MVLTKTLSTQRKTGNGIGIKLKHVVDNPVQSPGKELLNNNYIHPFRVPGVFARINYLLYRSNFKIYTVHSL